MIHYTYTKILFTLNTVIFAYEESLNIEIIKDEIRLQKSGYVNATRRGPRDPTLWMIKIIIEDIDIEYRYLGELVRHVGTKSTVDPSN